MIELWHEWNSVQSFKVRLVLAEKKLSWTAHQVELLKFEHLRPDYLALNPNGVVPTLVHDGQVLFESSVICQYLDENFPEPTLTPSDPYARAQARIWLKFFDEVVHPFIRQASFELLYRPFLTTLSKAELEELLALHPDPKRASRFRTAASGASDPSAVRDAIDAFGRIYARLDASLQQNKWLVGSEFSLADVGMAAFVERIDHFGLGRLSDSFKHAKRWSTDVLARPSTMKARAPLEYRLPVQSSVET